MDDDHHDNGSQSVHVPVDTDGHDRRVAVSEASAHRLVLQARRDRAVRQSGGPEAIYHIRRRLVFAVRQR